VRERALAGESIGVCRVERKVEIQPNRMAEAKVAESILFTFVERFLEMRTESVLPSRSFVTQRDRLIGFLEKLKL
jgi:hypothetical protein